MAEEKEPIYGMERTAWCPECKRETKQRWIGFYYQYSQWECMACGRIVLGEPYKKG